MGLMTLLFTPHVQISSDNVNIDNINKLLLCCLTVLQEHEALIPYNIEYDSEEEALSIQQENYQCLLYSVFAKVSNFLNPLKQSYTNSLGSFLIAVEKDVVYTTDFRLFYLKTIQGIENEASYQDLDINLLNRLAEAAQSK